MSQPMTSSSDDPARVSTRIRVRTWLQSLVYPFRRPLPALLMAAYIALVTTGALASRHLGVLGVVAMVVACLVLVVALLSLASGYRPITRDAYQEALANAPWWHRTRATVEAAGIRLDPERCRPWSRMWRCDRLAWPVKATYVSLEPMDPVSARANGIHNAATLLRIDPRGIPMDRIFVRGTGELAVTVRVDGKPGAPGRGLADEGGGSP